jgi:hypothetical protein
MFARMAVMMVTSRFGMVLKPGSNSTAPRVLLLALRVQLRSLADRLTAQADEPTRLAFAECLDLVDELDVKSRLRKHPRNRASAVG